MKTRKRPRPAVSLKNSAKAPSLAASLKRLLSCRAQAVGAEEEEDYEEDETTTTGPSEEEGAAKQRGTLARLMVCVEKGGGGDKVRQGSLVGQTRVE